jgi:hypothetical protein
MEVHHHSHTSRKKWTHYFWEFLMLFLAVFCGFLAEYQLEHVIEHQREKQFMIFMLEDLENDTTELKRATIKADEVGRYSDSLIIFFNTLKKSGQAPAHLALLAGKAGQHQILINTDRTSSQLKNSGAMRLIRNKKVSDSILSYWKQIEISNVSLERFMRYRNTGRDLLFKLWIIPQVYISGSGIKADSIQYLRIIDEDPKKWDELANLVAMGGNISRSAHMKNLQQQFEMAKELISIIKEAYHLK